MPCQGAVPRCSVWVWCQGAVLMDIPGHATQEQTGKAGFQLRVNTKVHNQTRTKAAGGVLVEVLDARTKTPVEGYALGDCTPISTDSYAAVASWGGKTRLPAAPDAIKLRFVLLRARLYSFRFCSTDGTCTSP